MKFYLEDEHWYINVLFNKFNNKNSFLYYLILTVEIRNVSLSRCSTSDFSVIYFESFNVRLLNLKNKCTFSSYAEYTKICI